MATWPPDYIITQTGNYPIEKNPYSNLQNTISGLLAPGTVDVPISLDVFWEENARNLDENLHGTFISIATGQAISNGNPINTTIGISKVFVVVNAGSDTSGTITITGTSVNRNTGAETGSDTDTLTINGLTTDNSAADANGNIVYDFTGGYISSKWFRGSITLSTTDVNLSDVDIYQVAFEQFNDSPDVTITTFDVTTYVTNVLAKLDAYLYLVEPTGSTKCDIASISDINLTGVTANTAYRLRRGNINQAIDGTTDGIFVDLHFLPGGSSFFRDINVKVWANCTRMLDGVSGQSGYSGYSGSGVSGYSGYSGISGYSGYSGISGWSGISGFSGDNPEIPDHPEIPE